MDLKNHRKIYNESVSKEVFYKYCSLLYERHLVTGIGGNLSVRVGERILITPSGYSLRNIHPDIIVTVNDKGGILEGGIPTKDVEVHLGILRSRPEINAVCHIHGAFIIAMSALIESGPDVLPPITPGFVYFAYPLAMIPFMVPGTKEFAKAATEHFINPGCNALLLQNHGLLTAGRNFQEALDIAEEIDEAARIHLLTNGQFRIIPEKDVNEIKGLD